MTPSLLRHQRRVLALQLLERQLRTTPVHRLTGLAEAEIRKLHHMLHGRSPTSGPPPGAPTLLPTRRAQAGLSVFAAFYRCIDGGDGVRCVDADALMKSYDLFRGLADWHFGADPGLRFDFTMAWVIAQELASGRALLKPCPTCRIDYLIAEGAEVPPTCPFCALRRQLNRRLKP